MTRDSEIQRTILKLLADRTVQSRRLDGTGLAQVINERKLINSVTTPTAIQQAMWRLLMQGLAWINMSPRESEHWELAITAAGMALLKDEEFNPNDPAGYIDRLTTSVPNMSDVVKQYMQEALGAFNNQLYLASTVMLGAASEAAFLEMATAFKDTLTGKNKSKFEKQLDGKTNFVAKFTEFRKQVEPMKGSLPKDYADGMALMLDSVLDLLRINRNEAGHPTGRRFERDDCFTSLQMAARYLKRLYGLKGHFERQAASTTTSP